MPAPIIFDLPVESVKMRWLEPYVTAGLNEKTLGQQAKGVFAGFTVVPGLADFSIKLQVDPVLGFSGANVLDVTSRRYCVTVIQTAEVDLDLTTWASLDAYVTLEAQYQIGAPSFARLKVVDATELGSNQNLVLLAKVVVPGAGAIPSGNINMGYRLSAGDSVTELSKPPVNLVFNSGFEADVTGSSPKGWTAAGATTAVVSIANPRTGLKSLSSVITGASTITSAPMPVVPGNEYRVGAFLRTDGAGLAGTGVQLRIQYFDADFNAVSSVAIETPVTGIQATYVKRVQLVSIPDGVGHARLVFETDGGTSGNCFIDDVELSTPRTDALAHSAVFGGSSLAADQYHTHTSAGLSYAGGPAWADGTTNPGPVTTEAQLDKILTDLGTGAGTGAAKISFLPATPVDLTAVRVDTALNQLDDLKAGINIANTFSKHNDFNNTSSPNASAITAIGNGDKAGVIAQGGSTINTPGGDFTSVAGTTGPGVKALGSGTGPGVKGTGGASSNSWGGEFYGGSGIYGNGVLGQGLVTGVGVEGRGGVNTSNFGANTLNPPVAGPGTGGVFMGATGDAGGDGLQAWGRGNATNRTGVVGVGGFPTIPGTSGGHGGQFFGGDGTLHNQAGTGVRGIGGNTFGSVGVDLVGIGVFGQGGTFPTSGAGPGIGVLGQGTTDIGYGVKGNGNGAGGIGVYGEAAPENGSIGVYGKGDAIANTTGVKGLSGGTGPGVVGLSNGATASPTSVGVYGKGSTGGWFVGTTGGGIALEVNAAAVLGSIGIEAFGHGAPALDCYSGDGGQAYNLIRLQGYIKFNATNPLGTTPSTNQITPKSMLKVWGYFTLNNTILPATNDSFNVASIAQDLGTSTITINFASAFANLFYVVHARLPSQGGSAAYLAVSEGTRTTSSIQMTIQNGVTGAFMSAASMSGFSLEFSAAGSQL